MKIVHERIDEERFIEVSISPREMDLMNDYMIISKECFIEGEPTYVGIKLGMDMEENDEGY